MEENGAALDLRDVHRDHEDRRHGGGANNTGICPRFVSDHPRRTCGITLCMTLVLLILTILSMSSVAPTEYGLRYNRFTKTVSTSYVYRGGRHLVGPFSLLMPFPATRQNIEFSARTGAASGPLSTRTREGLALKLHFVFQYQLIRDQVPDLYKLAASNYEQLFAKVARDVLLKSAAHYNAPQYWTERTKIGEEMHNLVNQALSASHATCSGLQIMIIELPDTYEQSIIATQVNKQQMYTKENEQKAALIRAQIAVMVAEYEKNVTVTIAGANADAARVRQSAEAEAQQMKIDAEAAAFQVVQEKLGLSTPGLVEYQRALTLQQMPGSTFMYGVQNPVIVLGSSSPPSPAPAPAPSPSSSFSSAKSQFSSFTSEFQLAAAAALSTKPKCDANGGIAC
eukprot:CAMPEP_0206449498 /NCGR_PEP_ID=MMETSP0324_2-20121206/18124_1 /ASSEMBLY_ACC=CAM_ASM_000836 /TAXON_ID=2866 /ORGANISM="Crypthecodinium cohnii, Strain Seligo" /LENGTH=396 /DNA_ID=CAMNT_0053918885 /DNA_START=146 /DNA_END=1336 /DNA_ORIENTATION=-